MTESLNSYSANSLRWWTRTRRIRTAAELSFEAILADTLAAPVYIRLGAKMLHLRQLGFGPVAIARQLGIDRKTVTEALAKLARVRRGT